MKINLKLDKLESTLVTSLAELGGVAPDEVVRTALAVYLTSALEAAQKRNGAIQRKAAQETQDPELAEALGSEIYDPVLIALMGVKNA